MDVFVGLGGFKTMLDAAKGLKSINDAVVRNEAVIGLQEQILSAQEEYATLLQKVRSLEAEVADLKNWESEKLRYEYQRLNPGVHIPTLKADVAGPAGPHHLCPACYEQGKKSILQATPETRARYRVHLCPQCKTQLAFGAQAPLPQITQAHSDYDPFER